MITVEWRESDKVIIVEGSSDKKRVQLVLNEEVEVVCTNGTISQVKLDEFVEEFEDRDVYIFFDADQSGEKLRKQFKRELPEARHMYINKMYKEVASAPLYHLASVLLAANIDVKVQFLEQRVNE
ncbi:toprim domain-containing protein [Peribacillus asahii]|jgi:toprim domain protein|uniref:toprim domain-containing protein n=1 Tax=Peribacillus asahii TaxID=228899 RepID=UPI0015D6348F